MEHIAKQLGEKLLARQYFLATAESCTGGLVAKLITDIPGSSSWFDRGFVTYTNQSKIDMLGVAAETLETYGAVSQQTVEEMANGAITHSKAQCSIAISGVAGPSGGSAEKPVGTVCIAWGVPGAPVKSGTFLFNGDREQIRFQAADKALSVLAEMI